MEYSRHLNELEPTPEDRIGRSAEHSLWSLWKNPAFRRYLIGDGWANLAGYLYQVALPGMVLHLSQDAGMIGAVILITGAARIGLMAWGGALSDRFRPGRMLRTAATLRALIFTSLILVTLRGGLSLTAVIITSFLCGISEAMYQPARAAILPGLAAGSTLPSANAISAGLEKWAGLAGPLIASWVTLLALEVGRAGVRMEGQSEYTWVFLLQAVSAAGSALILSQVRTSQRVAMETARRKQWDPLAGSGKSPSWKDLARILWKRKTLRGWLLTAMAVNLIGVGPLAIGLPILASSRHGGSPQALGLWMAAAGCGALVGGLLPGWLPQPPANLPGKFFWINAIMLGASLAGLFGLEGMMVSLAAAFLASFLVSLVNVTATGMIQKEAPPEYLGRLMAMICMK